MHARPLSALNAEIATVSARLNALLLERVVALAARRAAVVADFDAGVEIPVISAHHDVCEATVRTILHKAGRRQKSRRTPITHLPAEQQRAYAKARASGFGKAAARQMATTP